MSKTPPLTIDRQYIKDLSFENPNAPDIFNDIAAQQPRISINMDLTPNAIGVRRYEIVLSLRVLATRSDESVVFLTDLHYVGLATVGPDVPEDSIERLVLVDTPRFLFPFARAILANAVRDGGYAPLVLNPVNFENFYENHKKGTLLKPRTQAAVGEAN